MGAIVDAYAVRLSRIELSKYVRQYNYDRCKSYPAHNTTAYSLERGYRVQCACAEVNGEVWASSRKEWSRETR